LIYVEAIVKLCYLSSLSSFCSSFHLVQDISELFPYHLVNDICAVGILAEAIIPK
jgi:hypothetical protein